MEEMDIYNPVKLRSAANRVEAEMIGELLDNCGIPSYTKDLESGNYMNIYMGYSIFGTDIYVREEDLEKARKVMAEMETSVCEETDGEEEISADEIRRSKSRAVETVLTVILGAVVLLTILLVVL